MKFRKLPFRLRFAPVRPLAATQRGFTLIELLVVIAIIALLVSILMPSLQMAQELARRSKCGVNSRNLGINFYMYAEDYNQVLPDNYHWLPDYALHGNPTNNGYKGYGLLYIGEYVSDVNSDMFYCPSKDYPTGYWYKRQKGYSYYVPGAAHNDARYRTIPVMDGWTVLQACRVDNGDMNQHPHLGDGVNLLRMDTSVYWWNQPEGGWPGFTWSPDNPSNNWNPWPYWWTTACDVVQ